MQTKKHTNQYPHKHPPGTFKTEPCNKCYDFDSKTWVSGAICRYGNLCVYAHSSEELRPRVRHSPQQPQQPRPTPPPTPWPQPTEHSPSPKNIWASGASGASKSPKSPILVVQSAGSLGTIDIPYSDMQHLLLPWLFTAMR